MEVVINMFVLKLLFFLMLMPCKDHFSQDTTENWSGHWN